MFAISVITCSHNPREDYIPRVIDSLKSQTVDTGSWEYLLIDNASREPLAGRIDLSWHPNARHVSEEKLGLTNARLCGIREAQGEILVFVDDDNVLEGNYLEQCLKIAETWPALGSWSGQTKPEFETEPAEWTRRYWGNLVIRRLDEDVWSNLPNLPETMPCGAGLCVRSKVAQQYLQLHETGKRDFVMDRKGNSLTSAGDNDLAACACDVGLGVGLFAALNLTHLIPAERVSENYLLRLVEGISYSGVIFRSFRSSDIPAQRTVTKFADLVRQFSMNGRERRFFKAWRRGEGRAVRELLARSKARDGGTPVAVSSGLANHGANAQP